MLIKHVRQYLDCLPETTAILVKVFANIDGLTKINLASQVISHPAELTEFVCGFNMGHIRCEFTDAGTGKEAADAKIKGTVYARFI